MSWFPRAQWYAMRAGVDCPMCLDAALTENPHSHLVAELPGSFARLSRNQTHSGYMVVIAERHVSELYELTRDERAAFVEDLARVGRAVADAFEPVKLDTLMMGHLCPHLHCHIYPQYEHDDPRRLIDVQEGDVVLSDPERERRIEVLRKKLTEQHC